LVYIKNKSYGFKALNGFPAEMVKLMEKIRGLFKTTAFLTFSGVWVVIKMQYIFLNRNNFY